jgi:hypothetical protein
MGAPKKPNPRSYILSVRLNRAEYEWVKAIADSLGTRYLSKVIRYIVNYCMPIDPAHLSPALREIRAAERSGILDELTQQARDRATASISGPAPHRRRPTQ